jgi:AraC-like DNA-binding protein
MTLISIYTEVQSRIELLNAVAYIIAATYLSFILYLKKSIPEREKVLLRVLLFGFIPAGGIFLLRVFELYLYPESLFGRNIYSIIVLAVILVQPVNFYCCSRLKASRCTLNTYLAGISLLVLLYISVDFLFYFRPEMATHTHFLLIIASLVIYALFNGLTLIRFSFKLSSLSVNAKEQIECYENDIYIFYISHAFSLLLAILLLSGCEFKYFNILTTVFTLINSVLFMKMAIHCHYENFLTEGHSGSFLNDSLPETYIKSREVPDNIKAEELYSRLLKYFEQKKPYLKPDLKIKEVALYLYTNKTYLSRIINEKNNQNFNQFVNYYRIEEVKRLFKENNNLNIQELCTLSGFGSMATFSIAFRYYVGYTPADWCKEQRLKNNME